MLRPARGKDPLRAACRSRRLETRPHARPDPGRHRVGGRSRGRPVEHSIRNQAAGEHFLQVTPKIPGGAPEMSPTRKQNAPSATSCCYPNLRELRVFESQAELTPRFSVRRTGIQDVGREDWRNLPNVTIHRITGEFQKPSRRRASESREGPTNYREFGCRFTPHRHVSGGGSMQHIAVEVVRDALESLVHG